MTFQGRKTSYFWERGGGILWEKTSHSRELRWHLRIQSPTPWRRVVFWQGKAIFWGEKMGTLYLGQENGIVFEDLVGQKATPLLCDCAPQVLFRGRQNLYFRGRKQYGRSGWIRVSLSAQRTR